MRQLTALSGVAATEIRSDPTTEDSVAEIPFLSVRQGLWATEGAPEFDKALEADYLEVVAGDEVKQRNDNPLEMESAGAYFVAEGNEHR